MSLATHTHNVVPAQNNSFLAQLKTFLENEDANRFDDIFYDFVVSGGTHGTAGSLTAAPASLTAYPGGHYVLETGSITYADNETTWVIVNKDLTGNLANFVRVVGTHYLIDSVSATKPALPADSAFLMEVTTAASAITAVVDIRSFSAVVGFFETTGALPTAGNKGQLAIVATTLYYDNGSIWQLIMDNPMTTAADIIVAGASGVPARLAKGTADQVLGMNNAAGAQEYKTVTAGDNITITHATGTITIAVSGTVTPPGLIAEYTGTTEPTGWRFCNAQAVDATVVSDLAKVLIPNADEWGRSAGVGTITVNTSTDVITSAGHGLTDADIVHFANTGGALPAGISKETVYFVINATPDTFKISLTSGGSAVDITGAGSGTNTVYDDVLMPDIRGRYGLGADNMGGASSANRVTDTEADNLGQTKGAEETTLVTANIPAHDHGSAGAHDHASAISDDAVASGSNTELVSTTFALGPTNSSGTDSVTPTNPWMSSAGVHTHASVGSDTAHNNMNPYITLNYIIKE